MKKKKALRRDRSAGGRILKAAALCLAVKNGLARSDSDGWVSCTYIFDHFIAFHTIRGHPPWTSNKLLNYDNDYDTLLLS